MRVFITVLILIFSFQSLSKADDISDFEIEGMSIGDSALDYLSEDELKNATDESTDDRIFIIKTLYSKKNELYETIQIAWKNIDIKKKIVSVTGIIDYPNNIKKCLKDMKTIEMELSELFPNAEKKDWGKYPGISGGHYFPVTFDLKKGGRAQVSCHDWLENSSIDDNLKISIFSEEFKIYLQNKN